MGPRVRARQRKGKFLAHPGEGLSPVTVWPGAGNWRQPLPFSADLSPSQADAPGSGCARGVAISAKC